MRLLAHRERSALELRQRLKQKGYSAPAIAAALARLGELDIQSDSRFAERYAASAVARGRSARLIQGELRARGIDAELASAASATTPEQEYERALAFARQRLTRMGSIPPEAVQRRIAGLLARRGYDAAVCQSVAEIVAGRENLDPDSEPDVP